MRYRITFTTANGDVEVKVFERLGDMINLMKKCSVYGLPFKAEGDWTI